MDPHTFERLKADVGDEGRRRIYSLLYWMALCDGEFHERERLVLEDWASQLELDAEARAAIEDEVRKSAPLSLNAGKPELELLVKGLVEIVAADDWLDDEEEQRLRTLADLIGLSHAEIQAALLKEDPSLRFRGS